MPYLYDRVRETTTTTGTGTITLAGAVSGYRTFSSVLNVSTDPVHYVIEDATNNAWECGVGTLASTTTLTRTTVTASSNSGSLVSFAAGTKSVWIDSPAAALPIHLGATYFPGPFTPGGRLTLTSGTPVTTSDVTGATTVYYTPYTSNNISLWDGTRWQWVTFAETSLALGTVTSGLPYDIFCYMNLGTFTLSKTAWTNGTTRATSITLQDGRYCASSSKLFLYLGTIYSTSTTATEDSQNKRFVFNMYNREARKIAKYESSNWTYSANATWRNFNNSSANRCEWVDGIGTTAVNLNASCRIYATAGTNNFGRLGIGVDVSGSTTPTAQTIAYMLNAAYDLNPVVNYIGVPGVGYHFAQVQEYCFINTTTLNYNGTGDGQGGIQGTIFN